MVRLSSEEQRKIDERLAAGASVLDAWFPRKKSPEMPKTTTWRERWMSEATPEPKRSKKDGVNLPQNMKRVSEGWSKDTLAEITGGHLQKCELTKGEWGYQSTDVDLVGSFPVRGSMYTVHIEVKAWRPGKKAFSFNQISKRETMFLNRARKAGEGALVCLVLLPIAPTSREYYTRREILSAYLVPWARWVALQEQLRANATGSYKGKSLREGDLGLIADCLIERCGKRWCFCARHWLVPLLGQVKNAPF